MRRSLGLVDSIGSQRMELLEGRQMLSAEETLILNIESSPESVVFADFTGDGAIDTAVLAPEAGEIQIWTPDGSGDLDLWATLEDERVGTGASRIQVLDVNADRLPDIGFFDADTQRFTSYVNNGDGSFEFAGGLQLAESATGFAIVYGGHGPVAEPVGPWIGSDAYGDYDEGFGHGEGDYGDGDDGDAGSGDGGDGTSGDGGDDGDYGDGGDDGTYGDGGYSEHEGHFVGDPFLVVWHDSLGAIELVDSYVLLPFVDGNDDGTRGDGTGEYELAWPFDGDYLELPNGIYFETGSGGDAIAIGDFNNDFEHDLVVSNRDDGTVSVIYYEERFEDLLDNGFDPTVDEFVTTETLEVGAEPVHINTFDVNADGFEDLLVANAADGTISILYGSRAGFINSDTVEVGEGLTQVFLNFNSFDNDLFVIGFHADGTVSELRFDGTSLRLDEQKVQVFSAFDVFLPRQVIVGEFTADPFIDLAVLNQADGKVHILSNITGASDDGHGDDYGGPPIDLSDIPVPGAPDLLSDFDSGESDTDDVTAYNNAADLFLKFDVNLAHVSADLTDLRETIVAFFEENGDQFDDDGFAYSPSLWVNLFAGNVYIGSAEIEQGAQSVTVQTDGFTVLREGTHQIRVGFAVGAPGLRGLLGTRSAPLELEVRVPKVDIDTSGAEDGETASIVRDDEGNVLLVLEDENGEGEQLNLGAFEDLPEITGSVVTVRETKPDAGASRYAAGKSDEGLVLYVRSTEGDWSGRNLTEEIEDAEPIEESNIEVLVTPWGNVNMAGLNEQGELIFYWQDGSVDNSGQTNWNFVNLADSQLRDNGQAVPDYASSLSSFVTPWGAMNVAGIDSDGHLRVIWWAPGMDNWASTDLTEILGSTPLTGDVSSWVTPWGGINIVGLNTDGEMVAVWWAPGGEWTVSPIGENLSAPTMVHGSLTSFISETGDTFIAGITSEGGVGVFSWTLQDFTWSFASVGEFPVDATLIGSVSGYYTQDDQSMTLLVGSLEGDVYELVGDAFDIDGDWTTGLYSAA